MMLRVDSIHSFYSTSQALFGVSLQMQEKEIVCLLGRNGAGKSTTFRAIMGLTPPRQGKVFFKEKDITRLPTYRIARLGLGYVPPDRRIFPGLTVRENLEIPVKKRLNAEGAWTIDKVSDLFPQLRILAASKGAYLSGGEQQMLTIARTLMGDPELLLLDEPSEGLAPLIVRHMGERIAELKNHGLTILIAEMNVKFAMKFSERAYILEKGAICYEGSVANLRQNEEVMHAYLAV
jgi:branched-chain amino acid transport system ATP-binding protein